VEYRGNGGKKKMRNGEKKTQEDEIGPDKGENRKKKYGEEQICPFAQLHKPLTL
jgi:hypothetical protein